MSRFQANMVFLPSSCFVIEGGYTAHGTPKIELGKLNFHDFSCPTGSFYLPCHFPPKSETLTQTIRVLTLHAHHLQVLPVGVVGENSWENHKRKNIHLYNHIPNQVLHPKWSCTEPSRKKNGGVMGTCGFSILRSTAIHQSSLRG